MRTAIAAILLLAAPLWAPLLHAQAGEEDDDSGSQALERITVTGTRLARFQEEGTFPVTVLDREDLLASGHDNLGEFLKEMPFMGGSPLGTTTNRRGEGGGLSRGIETVELRGLGEERTLVLVNGRRFVSGGTGTGGLVDLGMIPVALVERVEILKTGASVEYGADAVAGVVNVITRDSVEGMELHANYRVTGRGDGDTVSANGVIGANTEVGQWIAGVSLSEQSAVGKDARDFSRSLRTVEGPGNRIVPWGSSAPPTGNFDTSQGRLTLADGADGDAPGDFRPFTDNDRFNFNPLEDLLQDSRRLSLFAQGQYAATPGLNLFMEALYYQRDSSQRIAPLPLFTARESGVAVAADNVYNPFGERIEDARRRMVEAGQRGFEQDNTAWRVVVGAEGLLGAWFWDASLNRARNSTDQRQNGDLLDDRLARALGPSFRDDAGRPRCGTPGNPISGCVPLNLFGGPGSISGAMLDYVGAQYLADRSHNDQTVVNLNLAGDLAELPAGPLGLAVGYEYRDESGADIPDPETVRGNTSGFARAVTRGSFDSHEAYAEMGVPVLRDSAFGESLDLDFGMRAARSSNFDLETVFEAGIHYRPVRHLALRATRSEAYRAPNIHELFGGAAQSNPVVQDPCADFSRLTAVEIERCTAQGVPADGSFDQTGNETPQLGGGNPDLEPEQADVLTLGLTYRPQWVNGLTLNLDYYDIQIEEAIGSLGANTVLEQCLATGAEAFCGRIDRAGDGTIERIHTELQNIAEESARGLDLGLRYTHGLGAGLASHNLMLSYVQERDLVPFEGAEPFVGAGEYDRDRFGAIPRWRGSYSLGWATGSFELGYKAQWIGSLTERGANVFPGTARDISDRLYHDLRAGYRMQPDMDVTLGIDNVTDADPPFFANAATANTDVSTYRLLGRTYWLRFEYRP